MLSDVRSYDQKSYLVTARLINTTKTTIYIYVLYIHTSFFALVFLVYPTSLTQS